MAATTQFKGAKGRLIQTGRTTRSVFVSYCHADFRDRDAFLKFLRPMCERLGDQLDAWCFWVDSADLVGGDRWKVEIRDALAQADVFIVLMSQEYVESPFCKGIELAYILDKCHRGQARVIGVALHKLNLQDFTVTTDDGVALSLEEVQCLPQGVSREKGQEREGLVPLTLWPERRDAWSEVQTQLERALTSTKSGVRAGPRPDAMPDAAKTAGASHSALALAAPYLCDRRMQVKLLARDVRGWHERQCIRPLVLLSEGHYDDSLTEWVQRLALYEFADALPTSPERRAELMFAEPRAVEWPDMALDAADAEESLRMSLGKRLGLGLQAAMPAIHRAQADGSVPAMWWTEVPSGQDADSAQHGLDALLQLLAGWPDLTPRTMLVVSIHLVTGEVGGASPLREAFVSRLDAAVGQGRVQAVKLGRLPLITASDLTFWADDDRVRPHLPASVQSLRERLGPQPLPMWPFVKQFNQWVDAQVPGRSGDPSRGSIR